MTLRATPFHARAADANRHNVWLSRNGVTLAERYDDVAEEALAARLNVVIADISWRWRVMLEGPTVEAFLSKLVTRDAAALAPGASFKALWLSDAGGVRGAGVVARLGRETFQLTASAPDRDWIASAAATMHVQMRDVSHESGGLAVIGPYAAADAQSSRARDGVGAARLPQTFLARDRSDIVALGRAWRLRDLVCAGRRRCSSGIA